MKKYLISCVQWLKAYLIFIRQAESVTTQLTLLLRLVLEKNQIDQFRIGRQHIRFWVANPLNFNSHLYVYSVFRAPYQLYSNPYRYSITVHFQSLHFYFSCMHSARMLRSTGKYNTDSPILSLNLCIRRSDHMSGSRGCRQVIYIY